MDAFLVLHNDRTKCSGYAINVQPRKTFFLIIKTAVNIFILSYKFYRVILSTNNNVFTKARCSFKN